MEPIRNRLRDLREDHDYTQQDVAGKIGITQRKYSYIETGVQQLTAEVLVALAKLYGVSIDYLLCQTDVPDRMPLSNGEAENRSGRLLSEPSPAHFAQKNPL